MESKYYTPEQDEIYVGFECEQSVLKTDGGHQLDIVSPKEYRKITIDEYSVALSSTWYRVKYLDKEDIESLGWKFYENDTIPLKAFSKNEDYKLTYISGMHRVSIANNLVEHTHFDGSIKNKSELKKLMKQLNIS